MPKTKPNKGAAKRFQLTGTGRIKRKHAFKRHNLRKRTITQKRSLTQTGYVHAADAPRIQQLLNR